MYSSSPCVEPGSNLGVKVERTLVLESDGAVWNPMSYCCVTLSKSFRLVMVRTIDMKIPPLQGCSEGRTG